MAIINKWYKVIVDGELIGVVTNQNFARYSETSHRMHVCDVQEGQYAIVNDMYYHDQWMFSPNPEMQVAYQDALVLPISEKEYSILVNPSAEPIESIEIASDIAVKESRVVPGAEETIEYVRKLKLEELSKECEKEIENGFSLVLADGASHHFSMSLRDQLNLQDLQKAVLNGDDLIYHADGELMQFYSTEDANAILLSARNWKQYNMALYNSMKSWINELEDIYAIKRITYDSAIPEQYCTAVLQSLALVV